VAKHSGSQDGERSTAITVASIGAIGIVLAAIVAGIFALAGGGGDGAGDGSTAVVEGSTDGGDSGCVGGNSVVQDSTVNCPPPPPDGPELVTADAGCGIPEREKRRRALRLKVLMWCAPPGVRGQYQYKLKVSVKNTGTEPLDVRAENFALLWRRLEPERWSAPQIGGAGARRPRRVTYEGERYWAIAANPNGSYDTISEEEATFTTKWSYQRLRPRQTSLHLRDSSVSLVVEDRGGRTRVRFNPGEDDLVFYVPKSAVRREANFAGLAYVPGDRVIALCPQRFWGPKVQPGYWNR
jgi:hypothetical protein